MLNPDYRDKLEVFLGLRDHEIIALRGLTRLEVLGKRLGTMLSGCL